MLLHFLPYLRGSQVVQRRRQWHPTPVLLPGRSHGWRSLVGCSLWGHEESDTTEQPHFHFSLSCIGEGNGNPLVFLPGESQGWGSLVGCHLWGLAESDTTESDLAAVAAGGAVVKNPPAKAGDKGEADLIPGLGRSLGGENGYPFQYACLGNPMDRGAWLATVSRVRKS